MRIREATGEDVDAIRAIARDSLSSAYTDFLDGETIERAVTEWYDDDFREKLDRQDTYVFAVEDDGDLIGFAECEVVGERQIVGKINWLHIAPGNRRRGIGVRLLVRAREELHQLGADQVKAFTLAENAGGNAFFANHGLEHVGTYEVDIGGETHTENVYVDSAFDDGDWRALEEMEDDGQQVFVSFGEVTRGSLAPFYPSYLGETGEERYSWFCGNCNCFDNAMDAMGRIECNRCGNRRKPTRWDASYL
ncbi:MAG: GNAT family N-acetyltransferase [Natrialbaceae archaeon]|nr:GNAT family N-acetyltransferase [Natrialbaceae archaeon]